MELIESDNYRREPSEAIRLLQQELADTNQEVLALTLELDRRIEELRAVETKLRKLLSEKTTLFQEVHHRVKNNLQIICTLLAMQIGQRDDPLVGPLKNAHQQVLAMALIHELLYQSETLAHINFGVYVKSLADRLFGAYCIDPARIHLELRVQPVQISMDQAIPCGLILNELLSNSLKHAFSDGREGRMTITLQRTGAGKVELAVADNGVGLPPNFCLEGERQSLGLKVVRALIEQLDGEYSVTSEAGSTFRILWTAPETAALDAGL
jgi:two-component sensor histidine kinase